MTYVQVGRPQSPGPPEEVDPLGFLRVQLRLLGQEPEETGGGQQLAQFSLVHGGSSSNETGASATLCCDFLGGSLPVEANQVMLCVTQRLEVRLHPCCQVDKDP